MGQIVWAGATSHTAAMFREPPEGVDNERAKRVFAAFDVLGENVRAADADIMVVIATDHFQTFTYDTLPIFAIGTGDAFRAWAEFGVPDHTFQGNAQFGDAVHRGLVQKGFDAVGARDMRIDHAFACPLQLMHKKWDLPILPIYVNCTIPPLPTPARCKAFGEALGQVLREQTVAKRVAILGTGGLSHSVGTPRTGIINQPWDNTFLQSYLAGDLSTVSAWNSAEIVEDAGNGASEVRNWILACAAAGAPKSRLLAYEPVEKWKTGIALTEMAL